MHSVSGVYTVTQRSAFKGKVLFTDKLNFNETETTKIHSKRVLLDENGHAIQSHHQH
jgi:hypothetical protein